MVMQIFVQVTCSMYDATYKPQPSSSPGDVTSWVGISVWAWPGVTKFTQNPVMLHHPTDNHRITYYFSDLVLCFCSLWHSHGPRWGLSLSLSVFLVELQNNFTVPVQTPTHKSRNQDLIIQKKKKRKSSTSMLLSVCVSILKTEKLSRKVSNWYYSMQMSFFMLIGNLNCYVSMWLLTLLVLIQWPLFWEKIFLFGDAVFRKLL